MARLSVLALVAVTACARSRTPIRTVEAPNATIVVTVVDDASWPMRLRETSIVLDGVRIGEGELVACNPGEHRVVVTSAVDIQCGLFTRSTLRLSVHAAFRLTTGDGAARINATLRNRPHGMRYEERVEVDFGMSGVAHASCETSSPHCVSTSVTAACASVAERIALHGDDFVRMPPMPAIGGPPIR